MGNFLNSFLFKSKSLFFYQSLFSKNIFQRISAKLVFLYIQVNRSYTEIDQLSISTHKELF